MSSMYGRPTQGTLVSNCLVLVVLTDFPSLGYGHHTILLACNITLARIERELLHGGRRLSYIEIDQTWHCDNSMFTPQMCE